MFSDSDRLIDGVLIRAIQPFAAPHRERAADSGRKMNLFLPRDYSAVRARVTEAFTLRRLSAKIIGEIESITTLSATAVRSTLCPGQSRVPTR
jgi:hypothetical protein